MDRSLYPEGVEVHQRNLDFTESSKASAIVKRATHLSKYGITSGLGVSVNVTDNTRVDVAVGGGYTPSGEYVELATNQLAVQLSSYVIGTKNYVLLMYDEAKSQPESHESDGTTQNTKAVAAPRLVVLTQAEYTALAASNALLSQNAKDRALLVAIVTANGPGIALASNSIQNAIAFDSAVYASKPVLVTGVNIISVDPTTIPGSGLLDYVSSTKQIRWQAPSESYGSFITLSASGAYTLLSSSGKSILVDISFSQLPGTNTTESVTVSDLYLQTIPRFSAVDAHHRSMIGSGQPTDINPHGMTLEDLSPGVSGTLEQHQDTQHSHGIAKGSTSTLLKCVVDTSINPDRLTVTGFSAGDLLYINGRRVQSLATSNIITFNDGSPEKSTYAIDISQDGALLKNLRVRFPTTGSVLDNRVQIINVSDSIGAGTKSLSVNTSNQITFDGGVSEYVSSAYDYTLRLYSSNKVDYIDVHVNNSAAPGSTLTDTLTFFSLPSRETNMLLAYVSWSGSATGFLGSGFGTANAPNAVYDRRIFGTTAAADMSSSAGYISIQKALVDSFSTPLIIGPNTWNSSDRQTLIEDLFKIGTLSGLNVTVNGGMIAYGGRLHNVATATLSLVNNQENSVYVSRDSVLTVISAPTATIGDEQYKYSLQNKNEEILLCTIVVTGGVESARYDNTSQFRRTLAHNLPYGVVGLDNKGRATINGPTDGGSGSAALTVITNETSAIGRAAIQATATTASSRGVGLRAVTSSGLGSAIQAEANGVNTTAINVTVNDSTAQGINIFSGGSLAFKSAVAAGGTGPAVIAESQGTTAAISTNNPVAVGGSNPSMTTGFTNTLSKANVCKVWGRFVTNGAGGFTVQAGFNVTSYTFSAGDVVITFASPMADGNYAICATVAGGFIVRPVSTTATSCTLSVEAPSTGAQRNMSTNGTDVSFTIFGLQGT